MADLWQEIDGSRLLEVPKDEKSALKMPESHSRLVNEVPFCEV